MLRPAPSRRLQGSALHGSKSLQSAEIQVEKAAGTTGGLLRLWRRRAPGIAVLYCVCGTWANEYEVREMTRMAGRVTLTSILRVRFVGSGLVDV